MRYEAFTHREFRARGMIDVVVARTDEIGWLQAGVFLIHHWCLRVKDAFFTETPAHDWPAKLERMIPAADRIALHPACARKLVEGAVAYASALGFEPHRDFKKSSPRLR